MQLAIAVVGAVGTIISAYLVAKVRDVKREVNGHTRRLEERIMVLEATIRRDRIRRENS